MEPEKKSNGAFVGLVIIIIILVIGGIYIWQSSQKEKTVTNQDAAVLDSLQLDAETTDTDTGVDVNTID